MPVTDPQMPEPQGQSSVIVVDARNGRVKADGSNIDLPLEGQQSALRSLETADVVVEVHEEGIFVTTDYDKRIVLLLQTKSERQMNAEKAARELGARVKPNDDVVKAEDPTTRLKRCFGNDYLPSGKPEERGLKGH
jgi:hypothetical protein